jgi:dihydroxyacid dehydratase/phosphogluconate dehydratase
MPVILGTQEAEIRRFTIQSQPRKKKTKSAQANSSRPYLKKIQYTQTHTTTHTHTKKAGGVAQVVVYLPSKLEALSSNSRTVKKKILNIKVHHIWLPHLCI